MSHNLSATDILDFWFSERVKPLWFRSTPEFDAEIRQRFESTWQAAHEGQLAEWEETVAGSLALVIVLDQFPLNMYRNQALGYASEGAALAVAKRAIARGQDGELSQSGKAFLYLPFMHSENLSDQERAVALFEAAGLIDNLRFARHHRDLIRRFGRFPHRNAALGRDNTPEESAYLNSKQAFLG